MAQRVRALALYSALLRASRGMPTFSRRGFVRKAAREGFDKNLNESDAAKIESLLQYGETMLETVQVQATHLSSRFARETTPPPARPVRGLARLKQQVSQKAAGAPIAPANSDVRDG